MTTRRSMEGTDPMEATKFRMERHGSRFWAIYDGDALVCVTVYKKGASEVIRRLGTVERQEDAS